jgi:uncharacterized protein
VAKAAGKLRVFLVATIVVVSAFVLLITLVMPSFMKFAADEELNFASPNALAFALVTLIAAVVAAGAMLWLFDRRRLGAIGLRGERAVSDTLIGLVFGAATLLIGLLAAWIVEVARPNAAVPSYSAFGLSVSMATALAAAAGEEVIFRGYVLHELLSKFTARMAIFVSSILFALGHVDALRADAMDGGAVGVVNLVLAGVLMALAVLKTGTLWLAIGLHAGWNFTLGPILGWIVSGQEVGFDSELFTLQGPTLMTGGAFGFEGSILGLLGTLLGIAILLPLPDRVQSAARQESRPGSDATG